MARTPRPRAAPSAAHSPESKPSPPPCDPPQPQQPPPLKAIKETLVQLADLGGAQCSIAEAAICFGVAEERLTGFLARHPKAMRAFEKGRQDALTKLRRAQFNLAQSNASMAMFLGRIYLGQSDRREAGDDQGFDLEGAGRRVRHKVAAVAAEHPTPGDLEGD